MSQRFAPASRNKPIFFLIISLVLVCAMSAAAAAEELLNRSPERGGISLELQLLRPKVTPSGEVRGDLSKLDERLSLIVTDKRSTAAIKFSEVMQKLARDVQIKNGVQVKDIDLFQRWWDTANDRKNKATDISASLLCDSEGEPSPGGVSTKHGFSYQCPRDEGDQAHTNPFAAENEPSDPKWAEAYTAIAFSNRFDLADKDLGRNCGEYRIIFARNSGFRDGNNRNLIIFEALVPNPNPPPTPQPTSSGKLFANLEGCRPIVEFWLTLSDPNMSTEVRGKALHDFFLVGLGANSIAPGLPEKDIGAVVDANNYGPNSGQIRTNQFMKNKHHWILREFKIDGGRFVPTTVKSNPANQLFAYDSRSNGLADYLVRKEVLDNLRGVKECVGDERSADTFSFAPTTRDDVDLLDKFNSFESDQEVRANGDIVELFKQDGAVAQKLDAALKAANSMLSTNNIIRRLRTQTCAGCHHYSVGDKGLGVYLDPVDFPDGWPSTLGGVDGKGFTHVSELEYENGEDYTVTPLPPDLSLQSLIANRPQRKSHIGFKGPDCEDPNHKCRYRISDTLKLILLPPRFENMVLYLSQFNAPK